MTNETSQGARGRTAASWATSRSVVVAMLLFGLVLLVVAYLGTSGEVDVGEQGIWLLGAGVPGLSFIVLAGLGIAMREYGSFTQRVDELEGPVHELHDRLMARYAQRQATQTGATRAAVLPAGVTYHREGCLLLAGKNGVTWHSLAEMEDQELSPCTVCEPDRNGRAAAQTGS